MGTSNATARAALDILRGLSATIMTPAHITGMRALLGSARGTGAEEDTLRSLQSLQAGLAVVLEGYAGGTTTTKSACETVLEHPQLLPLIMSLVAGDAHSAGKRRQLSAWAAVCKPWKDLARQDKLWRGVTKGLFPTEGGFGGKASLFASLAAYGRCLVETPLLVSTSWEEEAYIGYLEYEEIKLRLHVDIHDAKDGFVFYKGCGPLLLSHGQSDGCDVHFGGLGMEEMSAPFTGEERGVWRKPLYHSGKDDLAYAFREISIHVVVSCPKTGRSAVLWKEDNMDFERQAPDEKHPVTFNIEPRPGSRRVLSNTARLRAPAQAYLPPNCKTDHLEAEFSFYVEP